MDPLFDEPAPSGGGFDPRMLWRAAWRRKWLFAIPFVVCLTMAGVVIKTMTPIYWSSGQVQIKADHYRSRLLNDPSGQYGRARDFDREVAIEMETLLTSPDFLEKVIRERGLDEDVRRRFEAAGRGTLDDAQALLLADRMLRGMLRLEPDGSHLFRIGVRHPDPRQAYDLACFILDKFIEEYRLARLAPRASTRNFLESQRTLYQQDLDAAELALNEFLTSLAGSDLLGNPIGAANVGTAEERLARQRDRSAGADALELKSLEQGALAVIGAVPAVTTYARDAVAGSLMQELENLGVDLLVLAQSPELESVRSRLGSLRVQLNNRVEDMVALNHPGLGVMDRNRVSQYVYFALYQQVERTVGARVIGYIRVYRDFLARQPLQSSRLEELQGRVERARDLISTLDQEITAQRMNLDAGMSDVGLQIAIRREPAFSPVPIEPDKIKLAFMAVVLSLCLGSGLVVLAILMDRSFSTVTEIEQALGLKVLGTLPLIHDEHFARRKQRHLLLWAAVVVAILAVGALFFLVIYPRIS